MKKSYGPSFQLMALQRGAPINQCGKTAGRVMFCFTGGGGGNEFSFGQNEFELSIKDLHSVQEQLNIRVGASGERSEQKGRFMSHQHITLCTEMMNLRPRDVR